MAQGKLELDTMHRLHGVSGPRWMADHGLLSERLVTPHATYASQDDLALYAENGVSIAHSPLVSARMGSTLNSFAACRQLGINIGMATDTSPPDVLMNLLMGLVACRISEKAPDAVLSKDLYDAATLGDLVSALVGETVAWVRDHPELHVLVEREVDDGLPSELSRAISAYDGSPRWARRSCSASARGSQVVLPVTLTGASEACTAAPSWSVVPTPSGRPRQA